MRNNIASLKELLKLFEGNNWIIYGGYLMKYRKKLILGVM